MDKNQVSIYSSHPTPKWPPASVFKTESSKFQAVLEQSLSLIWPSGFSRMKVQSRSCCLYLNEVSGPVFYTLILSYLKLKCRTIQFSTGYLYCMSCQPSCWIPILHVKTWHLECKSQFNDQPHILLWIHSLAY